MYSLTRWQWTEASTASLYVRPSRSSDPPACFDDIGLEEIEDFRRALLDRHLAAPPSASSPCRATVSTRKNIQHVVHRPGALEQVSEDHRTDEAAESTEDADDATHSADVVGIIVGNVLVDSGLANAHQDANDEYQCGEDPNIGLEVDVCFALGQQLLPRDLVTDFDYGLLAKRHRRPDERALPSWPFGGHGNERIRSPVYLDDIVSHSGHGAAPQSNDALAR